MKKVLTTLFILSLNISFSQTQKNYSEIIGLIVSEYESDTLKVYKRFNNSTLLSTLELRKSLRDREYYKEYDNIEDSVKFDHFENIAAKLYNDTVTVKIENMRVNYSQKLKRAKKEDNDLIRHFYETNYEKRRKKRPIVFISIPLLSVDNKRAIVFGDYVCRGICGGTIFLLDKVNGKWKITDYKYRSHS
tara:strand:+ start:7412 stop:7981 length:570 start_codon:yes stop_codon:yes gene_type:complete